MKAIRSGALVFTLQGLEPDARPDALYSYLPLRKNQVEVMTILDRSLFTESEDLASRLNAVLSFPMHDNSQRLRVSHLASCLALEHSDACRTLLAHGMVPSGLVVHRAQYEAVVRAVWSLYAASEAQVAKLATLLTLETEQEAKNLPSVWGMMEALATKAPPQAYQMLSNFKESSWKALNSYVHAGLHPLRRQESGYPVRLVEQILRNGNGLALTAGMQGAIPALQKTHRQCLPLE
jgi:hypothetical protein